MIEYVNKCHEKTYHAINPSFKFYAASNAHRNFRFTVMNIKYKLLFVALENVWLPHN